MNRYLPNPGWPEPLYKLVTSDAKTRRAKYSVTELIQPPQMLQLKRRHAAEIVLDPADMIWRLFGKLAHGKLEKHAGLNSLVEEGLTMEVGGVTISGQPDLYENETIFDYKFTSVWAVKDGVKEEWAAQLNIYRLLFEAHGFPVTKLRIVAIARDWSAAAAKREEGYPKQVSILKVELWDKQDAENYLLCRVRAHEANEEKPDTELTPCTDEERWATPLKFAVMKDCNKRAVKLHDTLAAAEKHAADAGAKYFVEQRPREYKRCADYCEAAEFCKQHGTGLTVEEKLEAAGL